MVNSKRRRRRKDFQDLTGRQYGSFAVVSLLGKDKWGQSAWMCRCQLCGHEIVKKYQVLTRHVNRKCPRCPKIAPATRACSKCGKPKPLTAEFFVGDQSCPFGMCRICKDCAYTSKVARYDALRLEVIDRYSNGTRKCECCGESIIEFLALDHVHGNGRGLQNPIGGAGLNLMCKLKRLGYPPGIRVLCHNCNSCIGFFGRCHHKEPLDMLSFKPALNGCGIKPRPIDKTLDQQAKQSQTCSRCKTEFPMNANYFYRNRTNKTGFSRMCRECSRPYLSVRTMRYRRSLKVEVITRYGGKCACCGESGMPFLSMDHVGRGGHRDRQENGSLYDRLKREGFPTSGYRVLCYNCNVADGHHGICPHAAKTD